MPTAVALRPRSFSELFDAAFLLAREQFRPLATLSALVAIPAIVLNVVNVALFGPVAAPTVASPGDVSALLRTLPLTLVVLCWYFVGVAALLRTASDAYLGLPVDVGASLRHSTRRAPAIVGAHLLAYLVALAVLLAAVLVIAIGGAALGGVLRAAGARGTAATIGAMTIGVVGATAALATTAAVLARYVNMSAVLMLEGGGAIAALRRSSELGAGHRWRIVGLFAILGALSLTFSITAIGLGSLAGSVYVSNLVATLFSIPLYPLVACVLTALYYDLRIRKEGFDIAYAARALGGAEQPAPAA